MLTSGLEGNATQDGFGHDLYKAHMEGTIFEKAFHNHRIKTLVALAEELGIDQDQQVLDLGCNTAPVMSALLREGVDLIGVDIVREDVKRAETNLKGLDLPHDNLAVADGTLLPFRDEAFDTILLIDVLEHTSHPRRMVEEARRALRPGGRAIATVPWAYHPLVKFTILRKLLSSRKTIDRHPDLPFTFQKLKGLFPDFEPLFFRHVFHWVCLLGVFSKGE